MMDAESKQRHRRRKRAQRMALAQREMAKDGDSAEDESPVREKPQRPPNRRKKSKEPLAEEDIIDGFAILGFKSYEDLELALKLATKENVKRLTELERPKHESRPHITHHISAHHTHSITLTQDPATSDDSGRASERLTSSSVAPRDADSSRDRLSDASSRCSSGKGYICDSEGDDDKGSDASSVIFGSAPASRKHEFPGALPPSLPLSNGTSNSPVPAPTPTDLPAPSPAPAQLPPPPPPYTVASAAVRIEEQSPPPKRTAVAAPLDVVMTVTAAPSSPPAAMSAPPTVAQQPPPAAVAPVVPMMPPHDHAPTSNRVVRTESPAVATSAPAYHAPYQPLYTPYSQTPYSVPQVQQQQPPLQQQPPPVAAIPMAAAVTTTMPAQAHQPAAAVRPPSRGHSPTRERESYSSNVSSLSRSSVPPPQGSGGGCQPPPAQVASQPTATATTVSSSLNLGKSSSSSSWQQQATPTRLSPAPPRPTPPLHQSFPPPMFTAPLPPSSSSTVSRASPLTPTVPPQAQPPPPTAASNPNPFSAESLFQTNQTDMLRRELDNRFLATQDRSLNVAPPPYLRTEMHQHQHHHTHVHQHTTSLLPPPSSSTLFPSPMFKEIPKLGSVESPFYRQNIGMPNYPGYTPSLLHPGLTAGPTPFVPPNHLGSFQPKTVVSSSDPSKPKTTKTGKWNAMHVRIAWEIYHHQQKSGEAKSGPAKDLLRPPTHLFSPSVHQSRPHELPFPPSLAAAHRPPAYEQPPHHSSLFAAPGSHIGRSAISPFTRYGAGFGPSGPSPFGPFGPGRDLGLQLHDPWRGLQRTVPTFPSVSALPPSMPGMPPPGPWTMKPDPMIEQREREERERQERERERLRREREERERREREEKQRRLEQQQQQERERERREKERREQERLEREQRERERLLHQQRLAESKQMAPVLRDRSPHRNGLMDHTDHTQVRIKEEPRTKEEDQMSRATDPRFHPYLRPAPHQMAPPPTHMLDRSRMLMGHHYQPQATHWPPPTDPFYRYEHLRYNPLMDAIRVEEERAKLFGGYPPHPSQLRGKDPSLMHLRPPQMTHKMCGTPPTDLHKKEEPR